MPLAYLAIARVKSLTDNALGLYIHIPFCERKCNYCDFYSAFYSEDMLNIYLSALKGEIKKWGGKTNRPIDTVYIGGGTPSLLGKEIIALSDCIRNSFSLCKDIEFTAEVNPSSSDIFLKYAKAAGVNRLSIGVQSGCDTALKKLGRTHTAQDSVQTVKNAEKYGFCNISADLMTALPESNIDTLKRDIDFILSLDVQHISSYLLKIEPKTLFAKKEKLLDLPDDDGAAEQYLYMCDRLENGGYEHYEISNFARDAKYSRHNMKYWLCHDYIGIGPSAHSFINGRRFYYPENLHKFIKNPFAVQDGTGGNNAEKIMLGLRLSQGIDLSEIYGDIPQAIKTKISLFEKAGYLNSALPVISLTDKGMLISNSIITELLENEDI